MMKKILLSLVMVVLGIQFAVAQDYANPEIITTDTSVCGSYKWINGVEYTSSTIATFIKNDTVYVLNLEVNKNVIGDTLHPVEVRCTDNNYTFNSKNYTNSGVIRDTLTAANGCDSIVKLQLTLLTDTVDTMVVMACDSYTFHGIAYTESTNIDQVFTDGCKHTVLLALTINKSFVDTVQTINAHCSYRWYDSTFTIGDSIIHHRSIKTAAGCDSILSMRLVFDSASTDTVRAVKACTRYIWHGDTLRESGEFYFDSTISNCNHHYVLPLTIVDSYLDSIDTAVCEIFYWPFNNTYYTNSAVVTLNIGKNVNECDSIGKLKLTILHKPEVSIVGLNDLTEGESTTLRAECEDDGVKYQWYVNSTLQSDNTSDSIVLNNITNNTEIKLVTTGTNGCVANNWITVSTHSLGIEEGDNVSLNVYPNPTQRYINIEAGTQIKSIRIYNAIGQVVLFETANSNNMRIDLAGMQAGQYTMLLATEDGRTVSRSVVISK